MIQLGRGAIFGASLIFFLSQLRKAIRSLPIAVCGSSQRKEV